MDEPVKYPDTLPAPLSGKITPTDRRLISEVPGRPNFRTFQRDHHGTLDVSFIYTPRETEVFRFWWANWLARGAGFFAADWPLLHSRKDNVFRFTKPPAYELMGGALNGQGYYRVSAVVEIRGRGMLPTLELHSVSSRPYPVEELDVMDVGTPELFRLPPVVGHGDDLNMGDISNFTMSYTGIKYTTYRLEPENINVGKIENFNITGQVILITYSNYEPELLDVGKIERFTLTATKV